MRTLRALACVALILCVGAAMAAGPAGGWAQSNSNFATATGQYTSTHFVYNPTDFAWVLGTDSPTGDEGGFTVTADIEMWCDMSFYATDIYFHIGQDLGPSSTMSAEVGGYLSSNNGQWLFVTKKGVNPAEDDLTKLKFINSSRGVTNETVSDIDVAWSLKDKSGTFKPGTYSTGGNNGNLYGVTWLLDEGSTGLHPFVIKCTISPDQYQPDGHYEMDPVLVASPVL